MSVRNTSPAPYIIAAIIILIVIGGGYFGLRLLSGEKQPPAVAEQKAAPELKRMKNLPPETRLVVPPPAPSYEPDAPLLEQVRDALRKGIGPDEAYDMAQSLPDGPEKFDAAFLLLEYAADSGHGPATLAAAGYYDPTSTSPSGTIRKNPATAIEMYQAASAAGLSEAAEKLEQLRQWLSAKAQEGSFEARELLKNWP